MHTRVEAQSFRVLLIEGDPEESDRLANLLEAANHDVLPVSRLEEAPEALELQRFDVVLVSATAPEQGLRTLADHIRRMEQKSTAARHIPIVSTPRSASAGDALVGCEAELSGPFQPDQFSQMVLKLAEKVQSVPPAIPQSTAIAIFDDAEFAEQVCSDAELMVEIIDLYLEESKGQISSLKELEQQGDLEQLSKVAHTIKGSLSSLHALKARASAQELEHSAKAGLTAESRASLERLLLDLDELAPVLIAFRNVQAAI